MIAEVKICLSCNHVFHGRADKKFCNDYCRNTHNNHLNSDGNNYVRNINHCLRRNRRILSSLLPMPHSTMAKCAKQKLHSKGFAFSYFTHTQKNKKGHTVHYCYEYGYLVLTDERVMIVRKKTNT
ncbi:MAG: hypothetical protein Q8R50_10685 [Sediminibacterium sp.]|nr:hypothetical protein [Sediminibacterium sp.]